MRPSGRGERRNHTQILGYDLGGIDFTKGGTFVSGGRPNTPSPYVCPAGLSFTGFVSQTMDEQFVNTVLPGRDGQRRRPAGDPGSPDRLISPHS